MDLTKQAVDAALNRDWKKAILFNQQILKQNPKDIEALNRLGRALMETGLKTKAADIYHKVLRLDKFNSIAQKNLDLVKKSKVNRSVGHIPSSPPPLFIEEPGTTKTVSLIRIGDPKIVSRLRPGDPLTMAAREHCISVLTEHKEHIGRLPDDLTHRLGKLLKGGNKYQCWVKSTNPLKIFIVETYRSPQLNDTISFPSTEKLAYAAFTPPELVHDEKPNISSPEEDTGDSGNSLSDLENDLGSPNPSQENL